MQISGDAKLIAAAFVKARGEMTATVKEDGTGVYGKYATLAAIVKATSAILAKHGLAIIQESHLEDVGVVVDTWLIHESGTTMQFEPLPMPLDKRTPQTVGSAITYARRYQLAAVCGLAPDDDDGQAAEDEQTKVQAKPQAKAAPKTAPKSADVEFVPDTTIRMRITAEQAAIIAHLGKGAYGDEWDDNMHKLAEWASQGARAKLGDLYDIEAEKLIKALKKRIEQQNQAVAA